MSAEPVGRGGARAAQHLDLDALIDDRSTHILVCCGSGGVGKTTTAAALALRAADRGRRVVVLTIDPARRLAQSMGLEELDNEPRVVPGTETDSGGELQAMMLDMRRTFDEMVSGARHARPREGDLRQPLLPDDLHVVLRHAGVHGDGEAGPARRHRDGGT